MREIFISGCELLQAGMPGLTHMTITGMKNASQRKIATEYCKQNYSVPNKKANMEKINYIRFI